MARKILITGGIGSGKSSVAKILKKYGYIVWDADVFSRDVLFIDEVYDKINSLFGEDVFLEKGILKRELVRDKIFLDKSLKSKYEQILHPAIINLYNNRFESINKNSESAWVFYEASLVIEKGRSSDFDYCVVVTSHKDVKLERLKNNRNLDEKIALEIMNSQLSDIEKIKYANFIIDNSSDIDNLINQTKNLIEDLKNTFN